MYLVCLLPLALLVIALTNFFSLRAPNQTSPLTQTVGVMIPLRNEAANVQELIATLVAQVGQFHFYLLDDNSEDETLQLLYRYAKADSRFTVISGGPLAPGWIGKTWALQQLFEKSKEEILISLDADVRLSNDGLIRGISTLNSTGLDFISPYPRQIAKSLGERLVQPLLQWSWLTTVPLRIAERSQRTSIAIANGQFFIVRRSALEKIGGYQLVKSAVIDDVFLARQLIGSGSHGTVINGSTIATCRMYSSWSEIKLGYGKSLHQAFGSEFGALGAIIFLGLSSITPLIVGLLGNPFGWLGFALVILTRILSAIKSRGHIVDSLLHPFSIAVLIYLIVYSYSVRKTITWKGRTV